MRAFADLYDALDRTTSTNAKVEAMARYFDGVARAAPADGAWAVFLLTGRRLKRLLLSRKLVEWTLAEAHIPEWLLSECWGAVGDFAEIVTLLVDAFADKQQSMWSLWSLAQWIDRIQDLRALDEEAQRAEVVGWWRQLARRERFVLCKLLTGELRVGVSQTLVMRALAEVAHVEPAVIAHRLMGTWEPTAEFFAQLIAQANDQVLTVSRPYPFYLASPIAGDVKELGDRAEWLVEWKWDGIRGQLIRRAGEVHLWTRGEELVTERFPEVCNAARALPEGVVLDGELLAFDHARAEPLPFSVMQRRTGRTKLSDKILREAPVAFVAFDLLEKEGIDWRLRPLAERRAALEGLVLDENGAPRDRSLRVSPTVKELDWTALAALREESRARRVEGFMLKRLTSPYGTGRHKGDWWKWKILPFTVDAVLIQAQSGSGRRASLFTDYTFGVWEDGVLLPFAKAYSGLDNEEINELDKWIRGHTRERFGPVRVVEAEHVFEIAFEGIALSPRHKSGVAVRFPRMLRWRRDKRPADADTLAQVKALLDEKIE